MKFNADSGQLSGSTSADGRATTELSYKTCYCEENIWHLCANPVVAGRSLKVLWISSLSGVCPLWYQRAAPDVQTPVWWDYHVILLALDGGWNVWDLDTTLACPIPAGDYFNHTFNSASPIQPLFRVMDGEYYRSHFSSDRSHMRNADGEWLSAPPDWPVIGNGHSTFSQMLDFTNTAHGDVVSQETLLQEVLGLGSAG